MTQKLRISAVFVLALQLQQLTLPAVCMPMDRPAAACHDSRTPATGAVLTVAPVPVSCAQASMCGATATGLPALTFPVVASLNTRLSGAVAVTTPVPADPLAPPAPPPQA